MALRIIMPLCHAIFIWLYLILYVYIRYKWYKCSWSTSTWNAVIGWGAQKSARPDHGAETWASWVMAPECWPSTLLNRLFLYPYEWARFCQTHSDTWVSLHCLIFLPWAYLSQVLDKKLRCWFAMVCHCHLYFPGWMSTSCSGRGLPLWLARQGESADFALRWFCTTFCRCICHFYSFIGPGMCLCHFTCQELTIFFWSSA